MPFEMSVESPLYQNSFDEAKGSTGIWSLVHRVFFLPHLHASYLFSSTAPGFLLVLILFDLLKSLVLFLFPHKITFLGGHTK